MGCGSRRGEENVAYPKQFIDAEALALYACQNEHQHDYISVQNSKTFAKPAHKMLEIL